MSDRRRPVRHHRTLADGWKILVNRGVHYDAAAVETLLRRPADVRSLVASTLREPNVGGAPRPTFTERVRRLFNSNRATLPVRTRREHVTQMSVNQRTGVARVALREIVGGESSKTVRLRIGPGADVPAWVTYNEHDLRGINVSDGNLTIDPSQHRIDLRNSVLDGTTIDVDLAPRTLEPDEWVTRGGKATPLGHVDLSGASMRNAKFDQLTIGEGLVMVDTDVTGVDFSGLSLSPTAGDSYHPIDVTDSNITAEQVRQIDRTWNGRGFYPIQYRQYPPHDVQQLTGIPDDEMRVLMRSGEIEVRDNQTRRLVEKSFDPETCHIPQWELRRLLQSRAA